MQLRGMVVLKVSATIFVISSFSLFSIILIPTAVCGLGSPDGVHNSTLVPAWCGRLPNLTALIGVMIFAFIASAAILIGALIIKIFRLGFVRQK